MQICLGHGLAQSGAALFVSAVIAAGVVTFNGRTAARNAETITIAVDRSNKGDRLPQAPALQHPAGKNVAPDAARLQKAPTGCEPAFSPIVNPKLARVFGRCIA